jgi:hypothetical protein
MFKISIRTFLVAALALLAWRVYGGFVSHHPSAPAAIAAAPAKVTPLWFQSKGGDNPASAENDTPFPNGQLILTAQWTSPRYYPNPKVQAADIIPVTASARFPSMPAIAPASKTSTSVAGLEDLCR